MKKLFLVLSLLAAILALILSVLPLSNLAYIPAIAALILGIITLLIKKGNANKKTLNLSFLLTVIALCFTVYKSVFTTTEVGNIEDLEQKADQSVIESIETLENDIDVIEEETVSEEVIESFDETPTKTTTQEDKKEVKTEIPENKPKDDVPLEEF